jgi:hypothetical protein
MRRTSARAVVRTFVSLPVRRMVAAAAAVAAEGCRFRPTGRVRADSVPQQAGRAGLVQSDP